MVLTKVSNTRKAAFLTFVVVSLKRFTLEKTEIDVCKSKLLKYNLIKSSVLKVQFLKISQ